MSNGPDSFFLDDQTKALGDQANREKKIETNNETELECDYDLIRAQELEIENNKLRDDINQLRKLYDADTGDDLINSEIKRQFITYGEELQRYRDECIQYKTIIVTQNRLIDKYTNKTYSKEDHNDLIADSTNEYEMVYNTQKILNRYLLKISNICCWLII